MKVYSHLPGYLHRFQLMKLDRFMIRRHHILDVDRTPFLHSHPFAYVSIVTSGGYTELVLENGKLVERKHTRWSVIIRSPKTLHRITAVEPNTKTIFFVWKTGTWSLERHPEVPTPPEYNDVPDGMYVFTGGYRKRLDGVWYTLQPSYKEAAASTTYSIHQNLRP